MHYFTLFILAVLFPTLAHSQIQVDEGIRKPKTMMVSGSSVIDKEETSTTTSNTTSEPTENAIMPNRNANAEQQYLIRNGDDAEEIAIPEKAAPPQPPVNPFTPAPETPKKTTYKRELKKMPTAQVERSIADDRIDDGYVQQLMKNNFSLTPDID